MQGVIEERADLLVFEYHSDTPVFAYRFISHGIYKGTNDPEASTGRMQRI